jgi:hypothetical protein
MTLPSFATGNPSCHEKFIVPLDPADTRVERYDVVPSDLVCHETLMNGAQLPVFGEWRDLAVCSTETVGRPLKDVRTRHPKINN